MTDCILGIDPGLSGGVAFLFLSNQDRVTADDMPVAGHEVDAATLCLRIEQMRPTVAIVERVHAMPKQGVVSTFKFGTGYGILLGVVAAQKIPLHLVSPVVWKKHFRLGPDKEDARALALRLFPACAGHFSRKRDHGRAEAALIALYGSQIILKHARAA